MAVDRPANPNPLGPLPEVCLTFASEAVNEAVIFLSSVDTAVDFPGLPESSGKKCLATFRIGAAFHLPSEENSGQAYREGGEEMR